MDLDDNNLYTRSLGDMMAVLSYMSLVKGSKTKYMCYGTTSVPLNFGAITILLENPTVLFEVQFVAKTTRIGSKPDKHGHGNR
ncbi:hypothetical protein Tco_1007400 [Tanacetum coccineum]